MTQHRLRPSARLEEVEWLARRLAPFGSAVGAIVPRAFDSYARILHPAGGENGQALRWADVAARSGRIMHRKVQFHAIHRPGESEWEITPPDEGNLPAHLLKVLCAVLAEHTKTADSCCFCLWDGYGWLREGSSMTALFSLKDAPGAPPRAAAGTPDVTRFPFAAALKNMPLVHLPNRDYLLFEGPLDAAGELGWWMPRGHFVPQSPNLFWPSDHAWCVASEIDLPCTLVGGSDRLIEQLVGDPRLETWRVFAEDPVSWDSDDQNT